MMSTADAKPNPDLEKERDEKCVPVARGILGDMVSDMIPEDANVKIDYNPIVKKILQRMLDSDLNLTTEVSYIFQLLLGAFAGLNVAAQQCTTVPIDDVRYGRIAKQVLGILSDSNVPLVQLTPPEMVAAFEPVKDRLNALFASENMSMLEVKYVMDNIFDALKTVEGINAAQIENSTDRAIAKKFGIEFKTDLTMKKLDDVLKNP